MSKTTKPLLQPLRIPGGWSVAYNDGLYEVDPIEGTVDPWIFKEDLLQLKHESTGHLIDLGWHPAGELGTGHFLLRVYLGDCLGYLMHEFQTRDRQALVVEIERLLSNIVHIEDYISQPKEDPSP